MAKKVRLSDVAEKAGVSTATVSRVLNSKSTVASGTRQLVLEALTALGYEKPNELREASGSRIGIVAPDLNTTTTPLFIQEAVSLATASGYAPILLTRTSGNSAESYLQMLIKQQVSGVLFLTGFEQDDAETVYRYLQHGDRDIPFVTINGRNPNIGVPDFSTDHVEAARESVQYLFHSGHRSIGLMTGPERFRPAQNTAMGYRQAMMELCPASDQHVIHTLYSSEDGERAVDQLLDLGMTAVICGSDLLALGALRRVRERDMRVPEDVSIVGHDDSSLMSFTSPPLTSNREPIREIVAVAIGTLVEMMTGGNPPRVPMTFRSELITRGSTGSAPRET
ncbi:LacI family DNA-binding transcriptional regulator [Flaviflexus massiliensis]|uniref:LacI family DNA-binding transcriptional regulator n=1 Tax=Flaviflexus massiliensis TaxID=1522309 RepID=UPI0006D5B4B3|nr:LacI family DNA-binding transcriptional regulator [Flaviflexus massiliensis]